MPLLSRDLHPDSRAQIFSRHWKFSSRASPSPSLLSSTTIPSLQLLPLTSVLKHVPHCCSELTQVPGMLPFYVYCAILTYYSLLWPSRAYRPGVTRFVTPPRATGAFLRSRAAVRPPTDALTARGSTRRPRPCVLARRLRRRTR